MLEVNSLSFEYHDTPLFQQVSWSLFPGQLMHLQGGNGVGKTTLLRLLAGLLKPNSGNIFWNQHSIYEDLSAFQQDLCYVGHKMGLSLDLTVRENCLFDVHWQNKASDLAPMLQAFGLEDLIDIPCFQLSEGQRRRTALMRVAMSKARLWLLDEPYVALDSQSTQRLSNTFLNHLANKGLIVLTSHQELPPIFQNYERYYL